mmetsp:Transcript_21512/g.54052  ORF Transcript_21512/g.54052 Transcript_21512/m.54052 type:complete len:190 (-) Transcript_21512:91-660(-)|eukprot:CAMPEP_0173438012 /NCGR_PEP_ID=MMETSP1357-20121228/19123_1 /TAXON_ID=77926 /ORGANISM="Hemiselmis rufescens, Strain PCC563" /LENGTH=189 /DNA_ID=CAMNT_0014403253 /DNA_START=70 /DNA_END=639 /DNA_ORIENTATION=-
MMKSFILVVFAVAVEAWVPTSIPSAGSPFLGTSSASPPNPPYSHARRLSPPLGLSMEFLGFKLSSLGGIGDMIQKAEASHILVKGQQSLEGCNDLKELVTASIDFPAGVGLEQAFKNVAEQYSACPSARKGGYLGSMKPGQMVSEFDEVVFTRSVGTVHGPVETKFGHHLILIHSRQGDPEQKKSGGCG